ncbi:MAG TPA: protease pro-enzyme activation domain-containing protein, partial [Terracidiphilus sp.]
MVYRRWLSGWLALAAATLAATAFAQAPTLPSGPGVPSSRLSGDWRSSARVTIGSAVPALRPGAATLGSSSADTRLDRMLLLLEPSSAQKQALDAELANQQNPASPHFHQWLTPSQFAETYTNSATDVAAVVLWLESEGFVVAPLPAGRSWIEFSGTVAQVERAFQTRVESLPLPSGVRPVLVAPVSVPAALRPVIHGLVSLDGTVAEPAVTTWNPVARPAAELRTAASLADSEAVTPQLAAQALHLDAVHRSGITGVGETIALAARSNIQERDVAAFRKAFGLPESALRVLPNGADPGRTSDEAVALMSASWAGAAAPGAQIILVPAATTNATDGLDLSLAAIVDQSLAHTVAVGFSACEASLSEARQAFYAAVYRQAAAEGIA